MPAASSKIAIVGAGSVGATIAYAMLIRGLARHVTLFDIDARKARAQALDLNHGLQFLPHATIEGGDDVALCRDAQIVIVTAGAKQKPGMTRMDLADSNATMLRAVVPQVMPMAPDAIWLLVTNPVDVVTCLTLKLSGLPRNRVLGSGTVLDSARFRFLIGQRLRVATGSVSAYIAGEHGDSEIPLWSSATVANIPLHEWAVAQHGKLTVRDRVEIFQNVKDSAYQIVEGKGATHFAIGLATARIVESLLHDDNRVLPVSSLIEDLHGISDVCLSVPCIVNKTGVEPPLPIRLNANEEAGLRNSADTIRAAVRKLGF